MSNVGQHRIPRVTPRRAIGTLVLLLIATFASPGFALGQEAGVSASVALFSDNRILLDGQLDDWTAIDATVTVGGPQASDDPGSNGRMRWQVAADSTTIYFAATITDDTIVAGQNGENYWNEDSFELYLNLSGDLTATEYGPGISQIRISAVDIGETDIGALTLSGLGLDQHNVSGLVFATSDGWGAEIAVGIASLADPVVGDRFGLQVQANGSSGGDRDLKLSWSARDTDDSSFQDPSVFAQGIFTNAAPSAQADAAGDPDPPATVGPDGAAEAVDPNDGPTEVDSIVDGGPDVITGEEQRRSFFLAAVASAIAVLVLGLWFDRKRKADEARHAAARTVVPVAAVGAGEDPSPPVDSPPVDDDEFNAMLESILDDDAPTDGYE